MYSIGAVGLSGSYFGDGTGPIFLDNTDCFPANHSSLISCFIYEDDVGVHNCDHTEDASVICPGEVKSLLNYRLLSHSIPNPPSAVANRTCGNSSNGDIRLVGGKDQFEGRVEVCLDGQWGTICDNFWSDPDAAVVCSQLTFGPTDAQALGGATFGQGTGAIHFDRIFCGGNEERLTNCIHFPALEDTCSHVQDAGVICSSMFYCVYYNNESPLAIINAISSTSSCAKN